MKNLVFIVLLALCVSPAFAQVNQSVAVCDPTLYVHNCEKPNADGSVNVNDNFPGSSTPITASATGTTAATTATLAGAASKTTYICGFAIRANATAAATGNATITGTITGTLNFTQWTAPLASGIGVVEHNFTRCIPASAVNTGIAVVSAAPGSGGVISVSAWGFQQ